MFLFPSSSVIIGESCAGRTSKLWQKRLRRLFFGGGGKLFCSRNLRVISVHIKRKKIAFDFLLLPCLVWEVVAAAVARLKKS